MEKIKVAHIFNEINFSGAEIMYEQAAPLLEEHGCELIAISTGVHVGSFVEQFKKVNYKIYHKPVALKISAIPEFISYFFYFYQFLIVEKIKVLHIHRSTHYWFFALCARFAGVRSVRTVHNVFKNRRVTWIKAYLERLSAQKILNLTFQTIGESVYVNELNYYRNPTVRINNWFDSKKFFPAVNDVEKKELRHKLGIHGSEFVIVSVGGCSEIKNHSD